MCEEQSRDRKSASIRLICRIFVCKDGFSVLKTYLGSCSCDSMFPESCRTLYGAQRVKDDTMETLVDHYWVVQIH